MDLVMFTLQQFQLFSRMTMKRIRGRNVTKERTLMREMLFTAAAALVLMIRTSQNCAVSSLPAYPPILKVIICCCFFDYS
jgi:hypothetical protein